MLPAPRHEAQGHVGGALLSAALGRVPPAAPASRLRCDHVAWADHDADLLRLQHALVASVRAQNIAMGLAILAAADAAGAILHPISCRVANGRLRHFDREFEVATRPPSKASVSAAVRPELVPPEEEREADLGNLQAAELDAASGLPLARAWPAVAGGRRPTTWPCLE